MKAIWPVISVILLAEVEPFSTPYIEVNLVSGEKTWALFDRSLQRRIYLYSVLNFVLLTPHLTPLENGYRTSTRLELCRSWPRLVDDGNFISFVGICMLIPRLASALLVDGVTVSYFYLTSLHWFPRFFPYFFFFFFFILLKLFAKFFNFFWCFIPALYFSPFKLLSSFCDEDLWQRSSIRCIKYQKPFNCSLSLSQSDSKTWILTFESARSNS